MRHILNMKQNLMSLKEPVAEDLGDTCIAWACYVLFIIVSKALYICRFGSFYG